MKERLFLMMGIPALALIFAAIFVLIGCDNSGGGGGADTALKGKVVIKADDVEVAETVIDTPLTASYEGDEKLSSPAYKWYKTGVNSPVANAATYTPTTAGTYKVTLKAAGYKEKSATVTVHTAFLAGNVTILDENETVVTASVIGKAITAVYDGEEPGVTFQWFKDGNATPVHSGVVYTPVAIGTYTVKAIADGYGPKSAIIEITLQPLPGALTIRDEDGPVSGSVVNVQLFAGYDGDEEVIFQWYKDGDPTPVHTGDTFTPAAIGEYTLTISAEGYAPKSVTITIGYANLAGHITVRVGINPVDTASVNTPLTAHYDGIDTPVTFQWFRGIDITPVATGTSYTPTEADTYYVKASAEGYSSKNSNMVTINEVPNLNGNFYIVGNDTGSGYVNETYTADYDGTEGAVTYRWYKEGNASPVEVSASFKPTTVGEYYVTANVAGFNPKRVNITIVLPDLPGTLTVNTYTSTTHQPLTATYTGGVAVDYQWHHSGFGDVGTNSNTFTPVDAGQYTVTISAADYNPKTSEHITVELSTMTGNVTITPASPQVGNTLTANYSAAQPAAADRHYQWFKDGEAIGGATNQTYATLVESDYAGEYTVTISSHGYHSKQSAAVNVALLTMGTPTIRASNATAAATFAVPGETLNAFGSGTTYNWHKDGSAEAIHTGTSYAPTATGSYTITATSPGYTSATSAAVAVRALESTTEVSTYLNRQASNTSSTPVPLPCNFALGNMGTGSGWANLLTTIGTSRYVNLDLSACTMTGTAFDPRVNTTTPTTTGKNYIVSITLPDAARSITDGTRTSANTGGTPATFTGVFTGFTNLKTVNAVHLTSIGTCAFANLSSLTTVTLGENLTTLGNGGVFINCNNLTSVTIYQTVPFSSGTSDSFHSYYNSGAIGQFGTYSILSKLTIYVPAASLTAYRTASYWSNFAQRIVSIEYGNEPYLTTISAISTYLSSQSGGTSADNPIDLALGNYDLGTMTAAGGWRDLLNAINSSGKYVNLNLTACTMTGTEFNPDPTLTGNYASAKVLIVGLTLPNAATSIPAGDAAASSAFLNFSALKTVTAANVTSVGNWAFQALTNLTTVTMPNVTSIGRSFGACTSLTTVTMPKLTSIGGSAFSGCTGITAISFPANATIATHAFAYATNLATFTLTGTGNLSALTIGGKQALVRNNNEVASFPSASGNITIPNTITIIGDTAFNGCRTLTSVTLQATNVSRIGAAAFNDNQALATLTINTASSVPTLSNINAFNGTPATMQIKVPSTAVAAYKAAANWSDASIVDKIVAQ